MRSGSQSGGAWARVDDPSTGGNTEIGPLERRILREQLYRPSASESDVIAYLSAVEDDGVEPMIELQDAPSRPTPRRISRRVAVAGGLGIAVLGAFGTVRAATSSNPRSAATAPPPLVPSSLLDPREEREVRAALIAHLERPDDVLSGLVAKIGPVMSSSVANSSSLSGVTAGRTTVPLGPLGTTAAGHGITIVVATLEGSYGWQLTARARRSARGTLASAAATSAGVVSGVSTAVPRGRQELQVVFDVSAATRFAYSIVLVG